MGIPSDREFLAVASKRLGELFPTLPKQAGFHKRRRRRTETIEWLIGVFAADCPGHSDPVVLLDSTPVECWRTVETVRRSELADACGYGYCRSHSRWFWGMRLHLCCAPDGTPRASILAPADQPEREVAPASCPRRCVAASRSSATRATPGVSSRPRWRGGSRLRSCDRRGGTARRVHPPGDDPPTDRVGLLDLEGPARARATQGPHDHRPAGPHRLEAARARAGVWVNTLLGLPSRSFAQFWA
jgi:hypothetical protein